MRSPCPVQIPQDCRVGSGEDRVCSSLVERTRADRGPGALVSPRTWATGQAHEGHRLCPQVVASGASLKRQEQTEVEAGVEGRPGIGGEPERLRLAPRVVRLQGKDADDDRDRRQDRHERDEDPFGAAAGAWRRRGRPAPDP